jgi:type IV pilus assembly protein PilP
MRARRAGVAIGVLAAFTIVVGCGSEERVGPKTEEFGAERDAAAKRIARRKARDAGRPQQAKPAQVAKAASGGTLGVFDASFSYDPRGKRDPFRSFEWERPDRQGPDELRGPLEKFDLGQLDLVAVVWRTDNAKALVKDPSGQSYIVGHGTRIGKNEGLVLRIEDNEMVVKETYVDHLGHKSTKDIEMRIRGSEGG